MIDINGTSHRIVWAQLPLIRISNAPHSTPSASVDSGTNSIVTWSSGLNLNTLRYWM